MLIYVCALALKVKRVNSCTWKPFSEPWSITVTESRDITQCYLPRDPGDHAPR